MSSNGYRREPGGFQKARQPEFWKSPGDLGLAPASTLYIELHKEGFVFSRFEVHPVRGGVQV